MMDEERPSVAEVRERIDNMLTARPRGKVYQNALKFAYLTASRVSEVAGEYALLGRDAIRTEIFDIEAVLFRIQTARRKGRVRPVAIPLKHEPWAESLLKWFEVHDDAPPFGSLTMRSFQREAGLVFDGLMWPVEDYQKLVYVDIDSLKIIKERNIAGGLKEYLVEFPDMERRWVDDPKVRVNTIIKERHLRPFSMLSLRQLRLWELREFYHFTDSQLNVFTGSARSVTDLRFPPSLEDYTMNAPKTEEEQIEALKVSAAIYFKNLLAAKRELRYR